MTSDDHNKTKYFKRVKKVSSNAKHNYYYV